ncbi:DNA topoisomerase 3 [Anaerocolumna cellulosilytica]|uniref:DNA topoisomerase 3 n=1 Tax=Anaerocolumna cellulosilytica TaxID=433286 RepID=A0A6S6QYU8_9FIRM|nr:DNA topoisomerase III [Anaerocolumna cellulosilytica]MBB5194797.1 DNA topoisomerase-3 [Anaerocolumna cellulosilytica]BCJ94239.1 DNA topoisomerase 3 [Anaerocolumna cellulosilytica]
MKSLVIAEKPSVGRDIARVLKCTKNMGGAIEGEKYIVTWGLGHLVTLADPENYDEKYKTWNMENLPMLPEKFQLVVIKQTGKQYQAVKTQIQRKDVSDIIIATDAGREGELVARWILEKANNKKPVKRLWISSVTDKAIREGFAHLKDGKEYENLYQAAVARAEADWIVGMNATRALTCKYNASLSCGRVQTPTLAMIAKREEDIKKFIPVPYYGLIGKLSGMTLTWKDAKSGNTTTPDKSKIEELLKQLRGKDGIVTEFKTQLKKSYAPGLYDLTELQREANLRFDFSAKETLNIMQRLYENHKVLTYPRTDSRYLTTDIVGTLKERLEAVSIGQYKKLISVLLRKPIVTNSSFVDNQKVSDHHAIIPTEQFVNLDNMSTDERKIYDMVVRRFLAVLYPPYEYEEATVKVQVGSEQFTAKGRITKAIGYKEVYENQIEDKEETESLQEVSKDDVLKGIDFVITEGKTKPPAPFNEATLLSAMENPVQFLEEKNKEIVKTLGETGGLGTVATRADIIEKLFNSFLMEKRGKDIFITSKGKQLLELVPQDLKKPELTASLEMKLGKIAGGKLKKRELMKEMTAYTKEIVAEIKSGDGKFRHDNLTSKKCPACGKNMLAVNGKNSRMLVCQDRECGHRETIARTSNARCPICHKKMELVGQGEAQTFTCSCGHKEKLSAFQERRKKEGAGVSKKDVAKYMNQLKKEEKEPVNTAFADAFSKLKLDK